MRAPLVTLALLAAAAAAADPIATVDASNVQCTTAPAPRTPVLTLRPAPPTVAIVDTVGPDAWCHGTWTLALGKGTIDLQLEPRAEDRSRVCGSCAQRLTLVGVPAGTWTLRFPGGATTTAKVR